MQDIYLNYLIVALTTALLCFFIIGALIYYFIVKQIKKFTKNLAKSNLDNNKDLAEMMKNLGGNPFLSSQINKNFPLEEMKKIFKGGQEKNKKV